MIINYDSKLNLWRKRKKYSLKYETSFIYQTALTTQPVLPYKLVYGNKIYQVNIYFILFSASTVQSFKIELDTMKNLTTISWAHAVNNKTYLEAALASMCFNHLPAILCRYLLYFKFLLLLLFVNICYQSVCSYIPTGTTMYLLTIDKWLF